MLSPDLSQAQTRTETALRLMTPEYASPEQARGEAVATTTDVYSLGVVLYELLTDRRPHEFKTYTPAEIERAFLDTEIEEPSKVVGRMTDAGARLSRQIAGDLDNVVLMAMRKEPERRYQSVEQFSEDIRRYLEGMPVLARKDTFGYRTGKFIRRHKAAVTILALLMILAVAMAFQSVRVARERDRANQEAATAQAVTQSLVEMFEVADPGKARGNAITARELLEQGAVKIVKELKDQPVVQAKLLDTIGRLYQNIGLYDRAQTLLEDALKLRRQELGNEHPDVATSLDHLGEVAGLKADYARSESLLREALTMRRKLLGVESKDVAVSLNHLAMVMLNRGQYDEAERLHRESLEMKRKLLGQEHLEVATSLTSLGLTVHTKASAALLKRDPLASPNNLRLTVYEKECYDEAARMFRQSLEIRRKQLGPDHYLVAENMMHLALLPLLEGRFEEAEQPVREALAIYRNWFGEDHPETIITLRELALVLRYKGDCRAALPLFEEAIRRGVALLGPDHLQLAYAREGYASCLTKLGRYREAEENFLAAHASFQAVKGTQHMWTKLAARSFAELYEAWGKPDRAKPYRALLKSEENRSTPSKNP
jgi:serine/threonine-protein kinase